LSTPSGVLEDLVWFRCRVEMPAMQCYPEICARQGVFRRDRYKIYSEFPVLWGIGSTEVKTKMTPPEWKRVDPLCWFNRTNKWGGGGKGKEEAVFPLPPSRHLMKTTWVPKYWMQLQRRLAELCKMKSIVEKKNSLKYIWSAKWRLFSVSVVFWEMASVFIQALSGTWNSFCDFVFFFFNKTVLMRKTFRWHAVIHVRTKGHPISNLADFEKELAKRTRVNFEPPATQGGNRKLRWLSHPCFETAKLKRGIIASDAEIKPSSNDRRQTKNKVITPTNHDRPTSAPWTDQYSKQLPASAGIITHTRCKKMARTF